MMHGYSSAPFNAWSGWRLRIPGGPIGGQYHGFIAPDDTVDGEGWPAGHDETYRPSDDYRGLGGGWPREAGSGSSKDAWENEWGGTALREGETHSDHVYRSPAEIRPRPNASGGAHVVRAHQTRSTAGYAVAPGNYRGIGGLGAMFQTDGAGPPSGGISRLMNWRPIGPVVTMPAPVAHPILSLPDPSAPGFRPIFSVPAPPAPPVYPYAYGATNVVMQPPPPIQPVVSPSVSAWSAPPASPAPAPTVAASPANYLPSQGLVVPGITPATTPAPAPATAGIADWLAASTIWPGVANRWVVGGAALAAFFLMSGGKGGKR